MCDVKIKVGAEAIMNSIKGQTSCEASFRCCEKSSCKKSDSHENNSSTRDSNNSSTRDSNNNSTRDSNSNSNNSNSSGKGRAFGCTGLKRED